MRLYFTSNRTAVLDGDSPPTPHGSYGQSGGSAPDDSKVRFSTEPSPGQGVNVFSADIAQDVVSRFEYKDPFRPGRARWFALPVDLVRTLDLKRETFENVTGTPWNQWVVPVLDRRVPRNSTLRGKWAIIWVSRDGVASAKVSKKVEDVVLEVEVTTLTEFDPERDYILVEHHEEMAKEGGAGTKETWSLETLAGRTPQWAVFPTAWQEWVWNRDVVNSAVRYILKYAPSLKDEVNFAMGRDSKLNKTRAWRNVNDEVGRALSRKLNQPIDLGRLAGHSWTAVAAMPLRIAMRMSQHLPNDPWNPPVAKPEYENPETSGRVCLANLYGAYPRRGPGVDHAPQDRPFTGREGEFDPGDSKRFDSGRLLAAAGSA